MAEARAQMEVNVFGAARLIQLVLPAMRAQHSGTIVNVTSMGGKITTPLGAWYHATKFALEAISDCLRMEVAPFGIDVVVIDPGGIRTEWGGIAAEKVRAVSSRGPYAAQGNAVANSLTSETTRRRSSPPELIGTTITKAVTTRRPKTPVRRRLWRQTHDRLARPAARPRLRCVHTPGRQRPIHLSTGRSQRSRPPCTPRTTRCGRRDGTSIRQRFSHAASHDLFTRQPLTSPMRELAAALGPQAFKSLRGAATTCRLTVRVRLGRQVGRL